MGELLFYTLLAALCDRRRGRGAVWGKWDEWLLKPAARFGLGWAVGMAFGLSPPQASALAVVLVLGQLPEFDAVFAWWERRGQMKPERMTFYPRFLRDRIVMAMAWRGCLFGLPGVALAPWCGHQVLVLPFASMLAQLVAAFPLRRLSWYQWGHMEFFRGGLWALLAGVLSRAVG